MQTFLDGVQFTDKISQQNQAEWKRYMPLDG